jgi:hypothetical protein
MDVPRYFTQCASDQKSEKLGKKDPQKMTVDVSSIKQFFFIQLMILSK